MPYDDPRTDQMYLEIRIIVSGIVTGEDIEAEIVGPQEIYFVVKGTAGAGAFLLSQFLSEEQYKGPISEEVKAAKDNKYRNASAVYKRSLPKDGEQDGFIINTPFPIDDKQRLP